MIDSILDDLGIRGAGQSASSEDAIKAGEGLDSLHARLQGMKQNLAPFELSDIPSWAKTPISIIAAYELCPAFGITGDRLQDLASRYELMRQELAQQVTSHKTPFRVRASYF